MKEKNLYYHGHWHSPRQKHYESPLKNYRYYHPLHHGYYNWRPFFFYRGDFRQRLWYKLYNLGHGTSSKAAHWERVWWKLCSTKSRVAKKFCRRYPKKIWD